MYNTPIVHVQDVERQILWYNFCICVDAKPVYYKSWMERSILTVADITKGNKMLYKYDELMNKYGGHIRLIDYVCLIDALPKVWTELLKGHTLFMGICFQKK